MPVSNDHNNNCSKRSDTFFFFDPYVFTRRLLMMGLHGHSCSTSCCLLRIPIPVVHCFLFDVDPLSSIFSSVFPGFLYLILILKMLLLVIWSYSSALHAQAIGVCIFVSFVPLSPFDLNPVSCLHSSFSVFCLLQLVSLTIPFLL